MSLAEALLATVTLAVLLVYLRGANAARRFRFLEDQDGGAASTSTILVSVIIAARDEAADLAPCIRTLLGQTHSNLELILVDDRSTDGTSSIIDGLAGRDARVVPLHITALPHGSLGKPHALARGFERAQGHVILFTDADVSFEPDAVEMALRHFVSRRLQHLSILPAQRSRGFFLRLLILTANNSLLAVTRAHGIGRTRHHLGLGAFNMFAKDILAEPGTFEKIRMSVLEDMALAELAARRGAARDFLLSRSLVSIRWYPSFLSAVRGLEKIALAGARFRRSFLLAQALALAAFSVAPFVLLFHPHASKPSRGLAALACMAPVLVASSFRKHLRQPLAPGLLRPLGQLLWVAVMLRAILGSTMRGGCLEWRGTRYELSALSKAPREFRSSR